MPSFIEIGPSCRDDKRRADIFAHAVLNGIDFVEYERRPALPHPDVLVVTFLKDLPDPPNSDPDGAYTLVANPARVKVYGGRRIVGIQVLDVQRVGPRLEITVDQAGDFSDYWLALGWELQPDGSFLHVIPALDPQFSVALINFKAGCPVDFDCRTPKICPPGDVTEPVIDYLAKDYASFRKLLIDLIPQINPSWVERSPADLGIALLELLAYEGDRLSYFQDAAANEAYLDTTRQRVSARRHARLIDYKIDDGRNAWGYLHVAVSSPGIIGQGVKAVTRIGAPLRNQTVPPGVVIPESMLPPGAFEHDPALVGARVFETNFELHPRPENNTIFIHAWGNQECCLPRGATIVYLYSRIGNQAVRPSLAVGDYLLLEEVMGPLTGAEADADPAHRQVVQIVSADDTTDPAYSGALLPDGRLQVWAAGPQLPLVRVAWSREDGLTFPLCVGARPPGRPPLLNVSVARGNMVLVDHGRTVSETMAAGDIPAGQPYRLPLGQGPLTMRSEGPGGASRDAQPAIALDVAFPTGTQAWTAVPDLLESDPFARDYAVEVDNDGRAILRFGDDEYGARPSGALSFTATYRVGNGTAGNIGAESLAHLVQPAVALFPAIDFVRNPLPAQGGTDPETIEQVRQYAPAAFRAEQFRAVTEADYTQAAKKMPEVAGAVASFRWTGSWYTVFVGVDPRDPDDVITDPGGRTRLTDRLRTRVRQFLTRYKLAGYDLEIRSAEYVPLEIEMELCVKPDHFRGDVVAAVVRALSNRVNFDGSRGFFHPDNFTFAQPVYLSRLYAAIETVEGVESVFVTRFRRYGKLDNGELESGVLPIGPWEIARLDNDPQFMENGVIRITAGGGK